jgi:hypothetical protein
MGRSALQAEERDAAAATVKQDDGASRQKLICWKLWAGCGAIAGSKGKRRLRFALPGSRPLASDESSVGRVPIELSLDVGHPERDGR